MHVSIGLHVFKCTTCVPGSCGSQKEDSVRSLESGVTGGWSYKWVPGSELGSSGRTSNALKC